MKASKFFRISLSMAALLLVCAVGIWLWVKWEYHLPSEQFARQQFESHKIDYVRFVTLLQKNSSVAHIGSDGNVDIDGIHSHFVPEYRVLMQNIGAKSVMVRDDGSIEFQNWGVGCMICSDSYMGVRYVPDHIMKGSHPGWTQVEVTSLDDTKLPHENGSVATGLYVVPIEPNWFIFRFEYQE